MDGFFCAAHPSPSEAAIDALEGGLAASRAARQAAARDEADFLRADIEKLLMISEALWTILKEHHGYTDEELIKRVEEIDLRDGKLDGQVAKEPAKSCPTCNRVLIGQRPVCLYCGQEVERGPFER